MPTIRDHISPIKGTRRVLVSIGLLKFRVESEYIMYLGPKGVQNILLWVPSINYTATWTLWIDAVQGLGLRD